jgi:hypothetical protein
VRRDQELLELLRDEPELLAIADAVQQTQRGRRPGSRRRLAATVAIAACLAAVALAVAVARRDSAVAVETGGPFAHVVMQRTLDDTWYVPLDGHGPRRPSTFGLELWYSSDGGTVWTILRHDGTPVEAGVDTLTSGRSNVGPTIVNPNMNVREREQPLARLAARRLVRVLGLALQRYPVALGQPLERAREVEPLGLHHEPEDVAARRAAEAVVELLDRIDAERGRALLVERAQPMQPADAGALELRAGADELDEVDGVADPLARLSRVARHQSARPCGTKRSVHARIAKRSVMPAR